MSIWLLKAVCIWSGLDGPEIWSCGDNVLVGLIVCIQNEEQLK